MRSASLIVSLMFFATLILVSCEIDDTPTGVNSGNSGELDLPRTTDAVIHRPIEDFLEAQVTNSTVVWPFGDVSGWSGHPPGWANPMGWPYYYPYWVYVDWCNLVDPWLYEQQGIDLGTMISGDIMEQPLLDGGRRVNITLQGTNCWTIANICDFGLGPVRWPIVLGYAPEHIFVEGETPLVSGCSMVLKWTDGYQPYGPLPNILDVFIVGQIPWPDLYVEQWNFISNSGIGPLTNQPGYEEWGLTPWETGTSGTVRVHQLTLNNLATWPAEICDVGPVGNP